MPLFPCYIFVNIDQSEISAVLKTPKLIRYVAFNGIPASLRQDEVDSIMQIMENTYPFEVSSNLKVGDSVVVVKGPLAGMEGILVEERGSQRFALRIVSLQQSLLVNIPNDYLEFVEVVV